MGYIPDIKTTRRMYRLYGRGNSLAVVARAFGVTRQTVWDRFRRRDLPMRERPKPLPFVEFEGRRYTPGRGRYFRCTNGRRRLLHREVWRTRRGAIPEGHDIHHIDGDPSNNSLSNLECLPKAEHTRRYSPHNNQHTKGMARRSFKSKKCRVCGKAFRPHRAGARNEPPSAHSKRKFCSTCCAGLWRRGRPRGAVA